MENDILKWLLTSKDRGISSETMAAAMMGVEPGRGEYNYPHDPSDFNRCLKFLACVPGARNHMDKLSSISHVWSKLVEQWSVIEKCFLDEVGLDWCKGRHLKATKTYQLMKDITDA